MNKLLFLFFLLTSISLSQQQINEVFIFDGIEREYIVYIPESYNENIEFPVLFSFHGGSGYASDFIETNDMRSIADTANFIAVYPQGAIDPEGGTTSWIHKAPTDHDDIFFIEAIIDSLNLEYTIDQSRIYACGYSEGAILSYELGCRLNHKIAAFAAVSGSMLEDYYRNEIYGWDICSPVHPTGMMLIPGTVDQNPHSIYEGLSYVDMPLYMSVNDITTFWSNYNNTDFNSIITSIEDSAPNDGSYVERKRWLNGDNCTSIQELKIIGGDHDWPGSFGNMDINASDEIWNFVSMFNIDGKIDCPSLSKITPNKDYIFLNNTEGYLDLSQLYNKKYSIFSITGNRVLFGSTLSGNTFVDISSLNSGMYILTIDNKSFKLFKK